ncbi:MAG: class F sortase [Streptosporangiales bacterium]
MAAATAVLALIGAALIGAAALGQESPPQPAHTAAAQSGSGSASPSGPLPLRKSTKGGGTPSPYLPASNPTKIAIPAIDVHAKIMKLGVKKNGSIEVPPFEQDSRAGWYKRSPTPGQIGPSVILGHVDSEKYGPAVFFKLGALKKGDRVRVKRADGSVAHFRIDRVVRFPKDEFPTAAVYGSIDHAGLRLITCGGQFNPNRGHYEDNIIAYASFVPHGGGHRS